MAENREGDAKANNNVKKVEKKVEKVERKLEDTERRMFFLFKVYITCLTL